MEQKEARHRCIHLTRSQPHPQFATDWCIAYGVSSQTPRKASLHCQGHECVSSSSGNDLELWAAGFLGQEEAKISINTRTEPFMGFTRNFIGVWSCWHCVCLQM